MNNRVKKLEWGFRRGQGNAGQTNSVSERTCSKIEAEGGGTFLKRNRLDRWQQRTGSDSALIWLERT
jgi:hypothetical protein